MASATLNGGKEAASGGAAMMLMPVFEAGCGTLPDERLRCRRRGGDGSQREAAGGRGGGVGDVSGVRVSTK